MADTTDASKLPLSCLGPLLDVTHAEDFDVLAETISVVDEDVRSGKGGQVPPTRLLRAPRLLRSQRLLRGQRHPSSPARHHEAVKRPADTRCRSLMVVSLQ